MAAARHEAWLDSPVKAGESLTQRACLERILKYGLPREKEMIADRIDGPESPECLDYLRVWHQSLAMGRCSTAEGPSPVSWTDLDAWSRHTDTQPTEREAYALLGLDRIALSAQHPHNPPESE